jgi:hypothetical protein
MLALSWGMGSRRTSKLLVAMLVIMVMVVHGEVGVVKRLASPGALTVRRSWAVKRPWMHNVTS